MPSGYFLLKATEPSVESELSAAIESVGLSRGSDPEAISMILANALTTTPAAPSPTEPSEKASRSSSATLLPQFTPATELTEATLSGATLAA